jgi:Rrf2 family protein
MKLTTKSEYSLLLIISLARRQNQPPINLEKLCEENNVPYKYAEHLFSILKRAGIVKARRGSSGGYILGRSPEKISVAEIIRLMDGALAPTEAVSKYFYSETPIEKEKKLIAVFRDIRDYVSNKLEKLTIRDLL